MRSVGQTIDSIAAKRRSELTDNQLELMEKFYALLRDWDEGVITLDDVERMGPDTYSLMGIRLATPIADPINDIFCEYMERICLLHQGSGVMTGQGWVSEAEIRQHGGRVVQEVDQYTGEVYEAAQFPVGYEKGIDGTVDKRHPIYGLSQKRKYSFEEEWEEDDNGREKSAWFK